MLQYIKIITNSICTYTFTTLPVNHWEIFAKEFASEFDSAHIQNDLLYICLFKYLARSKTN